MQLLEWTSKKAAAFQTVGTLSVPFGLLYLDTAWLPASLAVFWLMSLMTTVALHRLFVHNAFKCSRAWQWALALLSCLSMTSSPLQWAVAHFTHHRYSDTDKDPHNTSLAKVFGVAYFTKASYDFAQARRLIRDPMQMAVHKHYLVVHFVWAALWFFVGGLDAVYFCWVFPTVVWMWAGVLHIRFSHRQGRPVNMHWLYGLVFLGDHLHRDHHAQPFHANYATEPGQLDLGYQFIRLIRSAR